MDGPLGSAPGGGALPFDAAEEVARVTPPVDGWPDAGAAEAGTAPTGTAGCAAPLFDGRAAAGVAALDPGSAVVPDAESAAAPEDPGAPEDVASAVQGEP